MAVYRNIQMSFWTDGKVVDDFTPEDRYFYLYLMTNPHTNLAGCYELSFKVASNETGYTKEVIENLIDRFESIHNIIRYNADTKEVLIINWSKFNWTSSGNTIKAVEKSINEIKCLEFKGFLQSLLNGEEEIPIPLARGMEETFTFMFTDTFTDKGKGGVGEKPKTSQLKKEFETLWSLYPKKQGKDKAYGYYERARKSGTTYEEVEQGIYAYQHYIKENDMDMQYVKMGSTFFSQKAWGDDWTAYKRSGQRSESRRDLFKRLIEEHRDDVRGDSSDCVSHSERVSASDQSLYERND